MSKKFSIKKGDLSLDNIKINLTKNNISKIFIDEYLELIKQLEKCKYSPHNDESINKDLYSRALKLINKIEIKQ